MLTLAAALSSCGPKPEPRTGEVLPPAREIAAPTPSAARRLDLTPCKLPGLEREGRCGTLEVYEDRAARTGRKIGLRVAVMPAESPAAPDPLFILVGGPGQSAVSTSKAFSGIFAPVLRERDVVLVDLRGTGGSNPLLCPLSGVDDDPQSYFGAMLPAAPLRACLARLDADPRLYTTPLAMADLDDVREALGYRQINLYGSSFGSRAALEYVRRYPGRVRSAVLRGVVPPNMSVPLYYARDSQRALDLLFAECAADAACGEAYPDLPGTLGAVRERLAREPVPVEVRLPGVEDRVFRFRLSLDDFNEALRNRLYDEESGEIPLYLHRAARGDYSDFGRLALRLRRTASQGQILSTGVFLSATCAEDVPFIDPAEAKRLAAGTFLGTYRVDQQVEACKVWPRGSLPDGYREDVRSDVPVLLLSGQRDPVAPPVWGEQVLRHLPNGHHVVLAQGYHGLPGPCVSSLMNDFVRRGTAEGLDASCVERMEKVPFLLPADAESPRPAPAAARTAVPAAVPDGLWEGALLVRRAEVELEIVVELAADAGGRPVGTVSLPHQDVHLLPLEDVKADGSSISFAFTRFSQNAKMDVRSTLRGTLSADGQTIRGEFVEGGRYTYPFVLERKGEAGTEWPRPAASIPVRTLSDNGDELKAAFNQAADKVRLVYLFSPTCPVCRQNARLTQRYILDPIKDDRLRVFAVWGPMQEKETAADAEAASVFLLDPRVTQFWTDDDVLANAYKAPLGLAGDLEPAYDVYMLFPPGVRWGETPPAPPYFMWIEKNLPAETRFNAEKLGEQVRRLLSAR